MKKVFIISILLLQLFFCLQEAAGVLSEGETKVYALQNRIFHHYHELGASFGYIPDDDFFNLYVVGLNYTFHFNDHLAWEVARGYWVINQEKDLRKDLEKDFGVAPTEFYKTTYTLHSHFVIKPFYGKDAFLNRRLINRETLFFLGAGVVNYEKQVGLGSENAPSISLALATKCFLSSHFCFNLELRDLINLREKSTENLLWLGIGLGFRFNLSPRSQVESSTMKTLNQYLKED